MKETSEFEKAQVAKWAALIAGIKDGKSKKVRRDTVIIGETKPFGTISRDGANITFEPAKKLQVSGFTVPEAEAAKRIYDTELVMSFNAY